MWKTCSWFSTLAIARHFHSAQFALAGAAVFRQGWSAAGLCFALLLRLRRFGLDRDGPRLYSCQLKRSLP